MQPARHAAAAASIAFPPRSIIRTPARATASGSLATAPRVPSAAEPAVASSAGRADIRAAPATVAVARDELRTNSRRVSPEARVDFLRAIRSPPCVVAPPQVGPARVIHALEVTLD